MMRKEEDDDTTRSIYIYGREVRKRGQAERVD